MPHALKGRKQSPEHVARRVAAVRAARESTPDWKEHVSEAMKGNRHGSGNTGKIQSEEQKRAHSERMTGREHSDETRAKMSVSQKRVWAGRTPEEIQEFLERKQATSFKPTNIERWLHAWLDEEGIAFVIHPWVRVTYGGIRRVLRPDVLLPAHNLVIEVQGCYWHGCIACYGEKARTDRVIEDEIRRTLMQEQGYSVFELLEHDIKSGSAPSVLMSAIDQA
jgi:G:T-mismatch repair DNA endonuclease (very short patch repair protein)